ncbi:MAG: hypothetical protein U0169_14010 [Polyangiaceae bacterium]
MPEIPPRRTPTVTLRTLRHLLVGGGAVVLAASGAHCARPLRPGELGQARLVAQVRGAAPLRLIPPGSDREGNAYVLYGAPDLPQVNVFVGQARGGWTSGCTLTKGDGYGIHGWVGFSENRRWYWAGEALVSVSGTSGTCFPVLDKDPASGTDLAFRAVFPWVSESPSRVSTVAWVKSPVDATPFQVKVDLLTGVYTNATPFEPAGSSAVEVLGVGANRARNEGYVLVRYKFGEEFRVEGRVVDVDARTKSSVFLDGAGAIDEYGVQGYLQSNDAGLVAGALADGRIVVFDAKGGRFLPPPGMTTVGVHARGGALFAVGTANGGPVIAPIDDDGNVGGPGRWTASENAARAFAAPIDLVDDRTLPSRAARWETSTTALGPWPFVSAHALDEYAEAETLWILAGPSVDFAGDRLTQIASVPVGVSYP